MSEHFEPEPELVEDSRSFNIGKCQKCLYFDVERDQEIPSDETLAPCLHPDMEEFELIVSGDSGCNLFEMADEYDEFDDDDDEEDDDEGDEDVDDDGEEIDEKEDRPY